MRISIGQILISLIIGFLLFGDLDKLKNKLISFLKQINTFINEKNRKKRT